MPRVHSTYSLLILLVLTASTLLFGGCAKSNPVGANLSQPGIVPLSVGNRWTYKDFSYDTTGVVTDSSGETHGILADTVLFGKRMFSYNGMFCANADSGLVEYGGLSFISEPPPPHDTTVTFSLLYRYPVSAGDQYSTIGWQIHVGTTDTSITVPAGTFHCIRYEFYQSSSTSKSYEYYDNYLCPQVGEVLDVSYFADSYPKSPNRVSSVMELQSYSLK